MNSEGSGELNLKKFEEMSLERSEEGYKAPANLKVTEKSVPTNSKKRKRSNATGGKPPRKLLSLRIRDQVDEEREMEEFIRKRNEYTEELVTELGEELKSQLRKELKEELRKEIKEELKSEIKEELKKESVPRRSKRLQRMTMDPMFKK